MSEDTYILAYGGRRDWDSVADTDGMTDLIDIKTGAPKPEHIDQVGLYVHGSPRPVRRRGCLYLSYDGWKVKWHDRRASMYRPEGIARLAAMKVEDHKHLPWIEREDLDIEKLEFHGGDVDGDLHEYRLNGKVIPSVSQLMEMAGVAKPFKPNEFVTEEDARHTADIGKAIHSWIEYYQHNPGVKIDEIADLISDHADDPDLGNFYAKYVMHWAEFCEEERFEPEHSEENILGYFDLGQRAR